MNRDSRMADVSRSALAFFSFLFNLHSIRMASHFAARREVGG